MPGSTKQYLEELGKRILDSLDEDPEMEPGQADTTPGNADKAGTEDEAPTNSRGSTKGSDGFVPHPKP
jgi:hypothetical protein